MIIRSVKQLKQLSSNASLECYIALNGGLRSSKIINYFEDKKHFSIQNLIDGSEQRLTEKQLDNPNLTNIGKAIKANALIIE